MFEAKYDHRIRVVHVEAITVGVELEPGLPFRVQPCAGRALDDVARGRRPDPVAHLAAVLGRALREPRRDLYARSPIINNPVIPVTIFSRSKGRRKRLFENAHIMQNTLK